MAGPSRKGFESGINIFPNTSPIAFRDAANTGYKQFYLNASDKFVIGDGLIPDANGTYDLGSDTFMFRNLYLGGVISLASELRLARGTAAAPIICFEGDRDGSGTGIWSSGANNIDLATNGNTVSNVDVNGNWTFGVSGVAVATHTFRGCTTVTETNSYSGGDLLLQVSNTSNTASSQAIIRAVVAGTSAGDAALQLQVTSGTSWYIAVDNSASDVLCMGTGAVAGTNQFWSLSSTGALTAGATGVTHTFTSSTYAISDSSTGTVNLTLTNSNNANAAAHALVNLSVGGTSAGDAGILFTIPSGTSWYVAADNSDSDAIVIGTGATVGGANKFRINGSADVSFGATGRSHTITGDSSTFTDSSTGSVSVTVSNSNNSAAGAHGRLILSTNGASAGDPYILFQISGVTDWYIGPDNSDSDALTIGNSTSPGAANLFRLATTGAITAGSGTVTHTFTGGQHKLTASSSGGTVFSYVQNTSNTASSNALADIEVAGTSAGNAWIRFSDTSTYWSVGARLADSNQFSISQSSALSGSNEYMWIATTGLVYFPSHGTTASAANAFLDSSTGQLQRSTSSIKYKKNVRDIEIDTSKIWDLRPVTYEDKTHDTTHFGFIAEEVAEVLPALVQYRGEEPDSVQYPLFAVLLLKEMKILRERINALEAING